MVRFRRAPVEARASRGCPGDRTETLARTSMFCEHDGCTAAAARRAIAEIASPYHCERLVRDAQLVGSELVTNALEHGAPGTVVLDVSVTGAGVTLCVSSHGDAERLPDVADWTLPAASSTSGRGLAVTRTLCDPVRVTSVPGGSSGRDLIAVTAHVV